MESNKGNKGVVGALIFIIIILLLVICYLLFGKKLLNNNEPDNTTTTTTASNVISASSINDVKNVFNKKLDTNASNITPEISDDLLKTNFSNVDKSIGDNKIIVSCNKSWDKTFEPDYVGCMSIKVVVNDTISYTAGGEGCSDSGDLYQYGKYLILVHTIDGCVDSGKVSIYENNVEVVSNDNMYYTIYESKYENSVNVNPTIIDGKLYFVVATATDGKMGLVSVDLTSSSLKQSTVGEFTAYHASQEA